MTESNKFACLLTAELATQGAVVKWAVCSIARRLAKVEPSQDQVVFLSPDKCKIVGKRNGFSHNIFLYGMKKRRCHLVHDVREH